MTYVIAALCQVVVAECRCHSASPPRRPRRLDCPITIDPCIPADRSGYRITYRYFSARYEIQVENPHDVTRDVRAVTLDGEILTDGRITRHDDGCVHHVHVMMDD